MVRQRLYLYTAIFQMVVLGFSAGFVKAQAFNSGFPSARDFTHPKDNLYFPKLRGLTYVYQTENKDILVTNETSTSLNTLTIQGIVCNITYNREWTYVKSLNRKLITRETYDFYAWDNQGNVWYFGRDQFNYLHNSNWSYAGMNMKGSWLAGKNGAIPGIVVPANPQTVLNQEQGINKNLLASKVLGISTSISTDLGNYNNCLKIQVSSPVSQSNVETRYFAPKVGLIILEKVKGNSSTTTLVKILNQPSAF